MTTLREQAAIAAMQGLLANTNESMHGVAETARICADALLAELERTFPQSERTAPKPAADATRLTCTAAERELIEARVNVLNGSTQDAWIRLERADSAVLAERSALPGGGGDHG